MTHVLETYDPEAYVDAQGVSKWENVIYTKIDWLVNNLTWELISQPERECCEVWMGIEYQVDIQWC